MPWRVTSPMYQRQRFVLDAEHSSKESAPADVLPIPATQS